MSRQATKKTQNDICIQDNTSIYHSWKKCTESTCCSTVSYSEKHHQVYTNIEQKESLPFPCVFETPKCSISEHVWCLIPRIRGHNVCLNPKILPRTSAVFRHLATPEKQPERAFGRQQTRRTFDNEHLAGQSCHSWNNSNYESECGSLLIGGEKGKKHNMEPK